MEFWGLGAIFPQAFNLMEYRPFGSLKKSILSAYKIANFVRLFFEIQIKCFGISHDITIAKFHNVMMIVRKYP